MISKLNKTRLENLGLELIYKDDAITFLKRVGLNGNFIPQWRNNKEKITDCPEIILTVDHGNYQLKY